MRFPWLPNKLNLNMSVFKLSMLTSQLEYTVISNACDWRNQYSQHYPKWGEFAVAVPARVAGFALCRDHYLTHWGTFNQGHFYHHLSLLNFIQDIFAFPDFVSLLGDHAAKHNKNSGQLHSDTNPQYVFKNRETFSNLVDFAKIGYLNFGFQVDFKQISMISRCFEVLLDTSESLAHWRSSWHPPGRPVGEGSGDADRTTQRSSHPKCCSHNDQNSSGRTLYIFVNLPALRSCFSYISTYQASWSRIGICWNYSSKAHDWLENYDWTISYFKYL